jgi:hypothetical protein
MSITDSFLPVLSFAPVLCIPRVLLNINENQIRKIFDELSIGIIDHIDILNKKNNRGEKFKRVYIHFKKWLDSENAKFAYERLINGKDIKIFYNYPWFWKISVYHK